jgi:hypothetical protein
MNAGEVKTSAEEERKESSPYGGELEVSKFPRTQFQRKLFENAVSMMPCGAFVGQFPTKLFFFFSPFLVVVGGGGGGPDVSQAPHFYPIRFGKPCPPFSYIPWLKCSSSVPQYKTVYFGEEPWTQFLSDGPMKSAYCQKKKN